MVRLRKKKPSFTDEEKALLAKYGIYHSSAAETFKSYEKLLPTNSGDSVSYRLPGEKDDT